MRRRRNNLNQQPMLYGDLGFPGQRQTVRATPETEHGLPLKQLGALIVLGTAMLGLAVANVLIIGPYLGWSTGLVLAFAAALWLRALTGEEKPPVDSIGVAVGVAFIVVWLVFGLGWVELIWWDVRCEWEARNKALFLALSVVIEAALALGVYRFSYEVIDPNWPPTIGIRLPELGVMWPGANKVFNEGDEDEVEVVVKGLPRPFRVNSSSDIPQELDADKVPPRGKIFAPSSGNIVDVRDLVNFVKLAPISGATFRPWKKRGWEHQQWKDVVDTWRFYGVVKSDGERSATKMLITDKKEALRRLSSAFINGTE